MRAFLFCDFNTDGLNKEVGYKGVQLVTISRPTAYGEYAPYHFVDTEQEFQTLVKGLRP